MLDYRSVYKLHPTELKNMHLGVKSLMQSSWWFQPSKEYSSEMASAPPIFRVKSWSNIWSQIDNKHLILSFIFRNIQTTLVGGLSPFEKYESNSIISPNRHENRKYLSCHHLVQLAPPIAMVVFSAGYRFPLWEKSNFRGRSHSPRLAGGNSAACRWLAEMQFRISRKDEWRIFLAL